MSRSFLYIFKDFLKELSAEYTLKIAFVGTLCNIGYVIITKDNKNIVIDKKYKYNTNGFTNFMIIDTNGKHYNVNNSLWFLKYDSIEDWSSVEKGDNLIIKYYGWRIPFLGLFPKVVSINNIKNNIKNNTKL